MNNIANHWSKIAKVVGCIADILSDLSGAQTKRRKFETKYYCVLSVGFCYNVFFIIVDFLKFCIE